MGLRKPGRVRGAAVPTFAWSRRAALGCKRPRGYRSGWDPPDKIGWRLGEPTGVTQHRAGGPGMLATHVDTPRETDS